MRKKPIALIIMDGFGANQKAEGNAIAAAKTPHLDELFAKYPRTDIQASGMDVGLPEGQMGNSEVGHTNIGAGRIVYQELTRITKSIQDGDFFQNEALLAAVQNCKQKGSALHLMGLLSDGGVHSHNTHLYALLKLAAQQGLSQVYVHCFLDGRDVSPTSGVGFVAELEAQMAAIGVGKVASVMGRYFAMDRDNRWERVKRAYDAIVRGAGTMVSDAQAYVEASYEKGITDEFVEPAVLTESAPVQAGDSVVFFNFRPDRARELTRTFIQEQVEGFEREGEFQPVFYVCMTQYDKTFEGVEIAFKPEKLVDTFGEYISRLGLRQLRIAETEKYAHVTFFFNGGVEAVYEGEDRALIASPKVATYDLQPEMSARPVTDEVVRRIESGQYDAIILNFANCDMVGHTGVFEAAVQAVETVDECVGRVVDLVLQQGGVALITADHGNADKMVDYETSEVFTAHTTNPVPFVICGAGDIALRTGRLADIAPTMLELMELPKPDVMTGESLIIF